MEAPQGSLRRYRTWLHRIHRLSTYMTGPWVNVVCLASSCLHEAEASSAQPRPHGQEAQRKKMTLPSLRSRPGTPVFVSPVTSQLGLTGEGKEGFNERRNWTE